MFGERGRRADVSGSGGVAGSGSKKEKNSDQPRFFLFWSTSGFASPSFHLSFPLSLSLRLVLAQPASSARRRGQLVRRRRRGAGEADRAGRGPAVRREEREGEREREENSEASSEKSGESERVSERERKRESACDKQRESDKKRCKNKRERREREG